MRKTILIGTAALAGISAPAAAQYYEAPAYTYTSPAQYVYTAPAPADYDYDTWQRNCREDMRDHRRDDGWRDCQEWRDDYDPAATSDYDYDYQYGDGYRGGYRNNGRYSYRYPSRRNTYGYRYGYRGGYSGGYSSGYSGGYAAGHGGGYVTTETGGVVVIVEQARGERYVPVIREEVIEETYETTEYETVRERVITQVPVKTRPPRQKYIKSVK